MQQVTIATAKRPLNLLLGPEYYLHVREACGACMVVNVKPIPREMLPPEVY
jgi:hypothetical protein